LYSRRIGQKISSWLFYFLEFEILSLFNLLCYGVFLGLEMRNSLIMNLTLHAKGTFTQRVNSAWYWICFFQLYFLISIALIWYTVSVNSIVGSLSLFNFSDKIFLYFIDSINLCSTMTLVIAGNPVMFFIKNRCNGPASIICRNYTIKLWIATFLNSGYNSMIIGQFVNGIFIVIFFYSFQSELFVMVIIRILYSKIVFYSDRWNRNYIR
jgi:hypothetical protein